MQFLNLARRLPAKKGLVGTLLALGTVAMVASVGALNGGKGLTASAYAPLSATFSGMLTSDWVMVIALAAVIALIWELAHGKGWGRVSIVLGVLAMALIGPAVATTLATATREPAPLVSKAATTPMVTAKTHVLVVG